MEARHFGSADRCPRGRHAAGRSATPTNPDTAVAHISANPGHHTRLAHLHEALTNLRSVLPPDTWEADWGDPHARLTDLKAKLAAGQWTHALDRVTEDNRTLINDLLTGALDT